MAEPDVLRAKKALRREARARREALDPTWCRDAELRIRARVATLLQERGAAVVASYAAMRGEPAPIAHEDLPSIRICWPVTDPETRALHFRAAQAALVPQPPWNVPEPVDGPWVEPEAFDAVLIPGLLFTTEGARLGYGGGYYDRFLPRLQKGALRIGICYAWQVMGELPVEAHDHNVDFLITEQDLHRIAVAAPPG